MATKVEKDGRCYAIIHRAEDWKEGLNFLTPAETVCQVGTWWYQEGKVLDAHRHIRNERLNELTQECIIVMSGSVEVYFYDENNRLFEAEKLYTGDLAVMVQGGHGYRILQPDTKVIECKNGPFISVEKDKQLI